MADYKEVNFDEAFMKWAKDLNDAYGDPYEYKFNLRRLRFHQGRVQFNSLTMQGQRPKAELIFEDIFRNDTSLSQKHIIRCKRETTSQAYVDLTQAIVCEERTRLNLSQIPPNIANKSGFTGGLDVQEIKHHEFKEKLVWEVDDEITVPPKSLIRAEVLVTENEHETQFQVETKVSGNVHCDVYDSSGEFMTSFDGDVFEILKTYSKNKKLLDFSTAGCVGFTSKGVCRFRYGIKKNVNVYADKN